LFVSGLRHHPIIHAVVCMASSNSIQPCGIRSFQLAVFRNVVRVKKSAVTMIFQNSSRRVACMFGSGFRRDRCKHVNTDTDSLGGVAGVGTGVPST